MDDFESPSAAIEEEQATGSRLADLADTIENETIANLFGSYDPKLNVNAPLQMAMQSDTAREIQLGDKKRYRKNLETDIQNGVMGEVSLNERAMQKDQAVSAIEPFVKRLNTTNLPPLSPDQNRKIEQVLKNQTPEINPVDHVTVETANDLGHEVADLKTLAPIAEKMGRPIIRDGRPDLKILSNPEGQFFIATLSALRKAYDESSEVFPVSRFSDLPVDDLNALYRFYRQELDEMHPHLNEGTNYKAYQLEGIATSILLKANDLREKHGTDLFEPCVAELMRSPSS